MPLRLRSVLWFVSHPCMHFCIYLLRSERRDPERSGVRGCYSPGGSHLLLCHDRKWRLRAQSAALKTLYPPVIYSRLPCRAYRTAAPCFLRRAVCEVQENRATVVLHQKKKKKPQDGRTSGDLAFQCLPSPLQVQRSSQTRG